MNMTERMAANKAKNAALRAAVDRLNLQSAPQLPQLPPHVTYLGMRNGKPHYRVIPVMVPKPSAAERIARWAEARVEDHREGGTCPHCNGTGRFTKHTNPAQSEGCHRCHRKGVLDSRDMAFFNRRLRGAGPICWAKSA